MVQLNVYQWIKARHCWTSIDLVRRCQSSLVSHWWLEEWQDQGLRWSPGLSKWMCSSRSL